MYRKFSKRIRLEAFERAKGRCECCTARLFPGNVEYDHAIPDALGGEPTLDNVRVICRTCHLSKTKRDVTTIAKSKRVRINHIGGRKRSKFRGWRKMNGDVVYAHD